MRISDWSSDVCSSDLREILRRLAIRLGIHLRRRYRRQQVGDAVVDEIDEALEGRARLQRRQFLHLDQTAGPDHARSEERRVGKEGVSTGRSRWAPAH